MATIEELEYYSRPGPMTDLSSVPAFALKGLPDDPEALCRVASELIVHEQLGELYGFEVPQERRHELQTRPAAKMVELILARRPSPLREPRPAELRMIGNCRHFSTLTVALLRSKGIPARARCGFASYFQEGKYVDHWVVERWDGPRESWIRADSQIDTKLKEAFAGQSQRGPLPRTLFDEADIAGGLFLSGPEAWLKCRSGEVESENFGIFDMWGLWFVRGNVVRDVAALNKIELLPWDGWGILETTEFAEGDTESIQYIDDVCSTVEGDDFDAIRFIYQDERLKAPKVIRSYAEAGGALIEVPELG